MSRRKMFFTHELGDLPPDRLDPLHDAAIANINGLADMATVKISLRSIADPDEILVTSKSSPACFSIDGWK